MAPKASSTKKSGSDGESPKAKLPKLPTEFILRPSQTELKQSAIVYVSPQILSITGWSTGSFVRITRGLTEVTLILQGWKPENEDKYDLNVILVSNEILSLTGMLLGERVELKKAVSQPAYATEIHVDFVSQDESKVQADIVDLGLVYENICTDSFLISQVSNLETVTDSLNELSLSSSAKRKQLTPFLVHPKTTKFELHSVEKLLPPPAPYSYASIGGLQSQIESLKRTIDVPLRHPEIFQRFGIDPPRGVLLHGSSGTGKSLLLKCIAHESQGCHIINISGPSIVSKYLGGTEEKLRDYFKEAIKYQPAIVLIDEIDSLTPSRNNEDVSEVDTRVTATLLMAMDSIDGAVIVIGATNRLNSIDAGLRRPGRFDQELEVPIPDADSRYDILSKQFISMKGQHDLTNEQIRAIASATHGYVGADLVSLCRESILKCISRGISSHENDQKVSYQDVEESRAEIRPSAMREIVLEMPKVSWDDIGGQEVLKRKLKEMVQLPLTAAQTFTRLGISAPKGLLLYGPPGCSKTLTAKALASESGLNFLAIKGPEIFNKYVGESEKKIREVFRKARTSAPSIVFIDEIDALATNRDSEDAGNVSRQVLNSMLNEIDGVEELKGVIIIGATNRPDSIDPALLRPGRLDRHVYVAPPDRHARRQILEKNTAQFNLPEPTLLLEKLSDLTDGFSGSETVLLCQEAGLAAVMEDKNATQVLERHFLAALNDISKNITPEMLEYYREFGEKYRAV
ncbi:hypothetical protein OGAPHI_000825 [Ogataea philodendri]|uniref:AAA+ ATPase domain-containing protein n=1 Tax=Ogataea philodendri TaxID=1378263 RepID=A0A9P8PH19_9ASCO|nr:uncharacterized protein OGAPHI_000825 [Ogataea philodendri]KAH3671114.1 hypothetical protein OGAPHI_000825 [Ogataea philodendri]